MTATAEAQPTPPPASQTAIRFPTASWRQVRREVGRQIGRIPHARSLFLLAIVMLALGSWAGVLVPQMMGRIVDLVGDGDGGSLWWIGAALLAAAVVGAVMNALGFYLVSRMSERVIANLREDMVGTALELPIHTVEDAGTGDLVSRSTDDVSELSAAVTETLPALSTSLFTIVATVLALFTLDWQFLILILVVTPVYYFAARAYLSRAPSRYARERAAMAERARRVLEAIRGRATVRAFSMEERMHVEIGNASWGVVRTGIRARTTMLIRLRGPLNMFMRVLDVVQSGYASLSRIVDVATDPPAPVPDSGAGAPEGRVELRDVSFSYGSGWAVSDVNLTIAPGETVAVVGASGAGKTTVAALIAGLRIPSAGEVLIDGYPVATLSDRERIARLAMVSQEVHVFSGSLREDLTLAKPDASDDELLAVLGRVHASSWFDQMPQGLDTVVGARGIQLDPVAAQQLALARVLLLDPAVIIMDEATAEAGSAGAAALEDAAEEVTRDRSALVVAHRLDQASRADRILVMDDGRIIEQGTHTELLARDGVYHRLWSAWSSGRRMSAED